VQRVCLAARKCACWQSQGLQTRSRHWQSALWLRLATWPTTLRARAIFDLLRLLKVFEDGPQGRTRHMCVDLIYLTDIGESLRRWSWGFLRLESEPRGMPPRWEITQILSHPVPSQISWGVRILNLYLNYVTSYTDPLLFLFERTYNSYDDMLCFIKSIFKNPLINRFQLYFLETFHTRFWSSWSDHEKRYFQKLDLLSSPWLFVWLYVTRESALNYKYFEK